MCFGSRTNPEFSTGVDEAPRLAHQYVDKPQSATSSTNKPSGGFPANTLFGRIKAIQEQIKAGAIEGVNRPTDDVEEPKETLKAPRNQYGRTVIDGLTASLQWTQGGGI